MGPFGTTGNTVASVIQLLVIVMVVLALLPPLLLHLTMVLERRSLPRVIIEASKPSVAHEPR